MVLHSLKCVIGLKTLLERMPWMCSKDLRRFLKMSITILDLVNKTHALLKTPNSVFWVRSAKVDTCCGFPVHSVLYCLAAHLNVAPNSIRLWSFEYTFAQSLDSLANNLVKNPRPQGQCLSKCEYSDWSPDKMSSGVEVNKGAMFPDKSMDLGSDWTFKPKLFLNNPFLSTISSFFQFTTKNSFQLQPIIYMSFITSCFIIFCFPIIFIKQFRTRFFLKCGSKAAGLNCYKSVRGRIIFFEAFILFWCWPKEAACWTRNTSCTPKSVTTNPSGSFHLHRLIWQ